MFRVALAALALVLALFAAGPIVGTAADRGFEIQTATLENGMQVVVVPNRRAPIVLHMVWYRVGGADDPPGKSGIAHFLEHLMFKGTPTVPSGELSKTVARLGGRDNAFTGYDYTSYHQTIGADQLEVVMRMEADRMVNLVLADDQVLPERDVILEERRKVVDNVPGAVLDEMISAKLFGPRGYGVPLIGYAREIAQLTRADAEAFYRVHYAPNNAILMIAGDVDLATVLPLARKYYGVLKPQVVPQRTRPNEIAITKAERVVHSDKRVRQIEWARDYVAPSYRAGDTQHAAALQVLAQILGGNQTSRLYQHLVLEKKLATSASASYSPGALGFTQFGVGVSLAPAAKPEDVERVVDELLRELLVTGVTPAELSQAKTRLLAANIYARDSLGSAIRIFGFGLSIGLTVEEINAWPSRIEAVSAEQVLAAARAVLIQDRSVTSTLLPAPAAGPGGG